MIYFKYQKGVKKFKSKTTKGNGDFMTNLFNFLKNKNRSLCFIDNRDKSKVFFYSNVNGYKIRYFRPLNEEIEIYPNEEDFFNKLRNFLEKTLYSNDGQFNFSCYRFYKNIKHITLEFN